jgi:hypothetical protein
VTAAAKPSTPEAEEVEVPLAPARGAAVSKFSDIVKQHMATSAFAQQWLHGAQEANAKALQALYPFIPRLLKEDILAMAQWCVSSYADTCIAQACRRRLCSSDLGFLCGEASQMCRNRKD